MKPTSNNYFESDMNSVTRSIVLLVTAFIALIFGMALAAYSSPVAHPLVRHLTITESLARGGLTLPPFFNTSFTSFLSSPDLLARAFSPAVLAVPHVSVASYLPSPIMVHNLYGTVGSLFGNSAMGHAPKVRLTQIPYTGFDFGPVGNTVYWLGLILFALSASYLLIYSQSRFFGSIATIIRSMALSIDSLRGV